MYSPESTVRNTGSYIYEEFMPTDGTDVKVCVAASVRVLEMCILTNVIHGPQFIHINKL